MGKHSKKQFKLKNIIIMIFILIIIGCISYLLYQKFILKANEDIYKDIVISEDIDTSKITENVAKVQTLQKENPDVKGWIQIDNTIINYPILQSTDNDYYLTHNYKKEESKYGSIFLKDKCDILNNNSNLIIYGHNMNNGQMFHSLLEYKNQDFYNEHKIIKIATNSEESQYSIVSVFKSRIFYQDEKDVFRFYNYINFDDEKEYNEYIENCKKIQLYDTGVTANYGEQLITLITCEYSQENGRMVVVAKKES